MEGVCKFCVYHILDADLYDKCILNSFVVGESDVCTSFFSREGLVNFIESYNSQQRDVAVEIINKLRLKFKNVVKKLIYKNSSRSNCLKLLLRKDIIIDNNTNLVFNVARIFACLSKFRFDDFIEIFVEDERIFYATFINNKKFLEFCRVFELECNEKSAFAFYIFKTIDFDEIKILLDYFGLDASELIFLFSLLH